MSNLFSISQFCVVMVGLALLTGCDATDTATLDRTAEETAKVEQVTAEVLQEVEQLARTYDNLLSDAGKSAGFVYVPAGSNDALADALAEAGPRGIVVLAAGEHYESATVPITHRVILVGEPGATLIVDTQPRTADDPVVDPALHVTDASRVAIWGIKILPQGDVGGTAILAERAPHLVVGRTRMLEHQYGVITDRTDDARIIYNTVALSAVEHQYGIAIVNGPHAKVVKNKVSNARIGIFAGDAHGKLIRNEMFGNGLGVMFCKLPSLLNLTSPSGAVLSADISATEWIASYNNAHDNSWGYLVIDGANNITLASTNKAANNAFYDIELAGDSERFGFFTPFSFENEVFVGDPGMTVKDCGVDNEVHGGTLVDTGADPCF